MFSLDMMVEYKGGGTEQWYRYSEHELDTSMFI